MIFASVGDTVPLALVLWDGATGMFPRARVYSGAVLITTIPLVHAADGYYYASWIPGTAGDFAVVYTVYSDAGFTTLAGNYELALDQLRITAFALAEEAGKVMQSFTFDAGTDSIIVNVWLEIDSAQVTSGLSNATLTMFDSTAGSLATPPAQVVPVGQGVFRFVVPNPGFPVGEYATFAVATIDHAGPPIRTFRGITGVTFSRAQ